MNALPAGSLEYSATTSSAAWSICPSSATQQLHVRLPRYRCTNKRCLQKIFRAGLACAPDNSKTTDQVTHWILQRLCLNRMSVAAAPKSLGLGWDIDNIHVRTAPAGNIKPDKQKSTEKIDGVVVTITALD